MPAEKSDGTENAAEKTDLKYIESIRLMDHGFHSDGHCAGCGTCVALGGGKPVWNHRCEQCFACLQWCPQQAIQFGEDTAGNPRYHHPEIKLNEMLSKRGNDDE